VALERQGFLEPMPNRFIGRQRDFRTNAGRVLLAHGFPYSQVTVFQDGLAGWEKMGLPTEH